MLQHSWLRLHGGTALIALFLLILLVSPVAVDGHAVLTSSEPAANARVEEQPDSIQLLFNQKLEAVSPNAVTVTGPSGAAVLSGALTVTEDGKGIVVPLEESLTDGAYTVAYKVLSLDGHSVSGSYSFTVAGVAQTPAASTSSTGEQVAADDQTSSVTPVTPTAPEVDHSHHDHSVTAEDDFELPSKLELLSGYDSSDYSMAAFFMAFLPMLGLALWSALLRSRSEEQMRRHRQRMLQMQRIYFIVLLLVIVTFIHRLVGFEDWEGVSRLMLETTPGISWLILLALSLIGMFALGYSKLFDLIWVFAAIAAKTQIGHAAAADDHLLASLMSGIHLLGAAVWLGGLLLILLMWRRYRYEAEKMLPTFSGMSIAAFLLLLFSGIISSALYLPDLGYILETRWGLVLIGKLVIVVLVGVVAAIIRGRFRRTGVTRLGAWLKLDITLMLVIAALAGILSSSEPIPQNKPLHWHVMGEEIHMTAEVHPLRQGYNDYGVTVWLPEDDGAPRLVELELLPGKTDEGGEAKSIALSEVEDDTDVLFLGFDTYFYRANGEEIDQPGWWRVLVKVTDSRGQQWEFEKTVKLY